MASIAFLVPVMEALKPVTDVLRGAPAIFPEPLSPYFQAGGMFDFINEDIGLTIAFIALLFLVDNLVVRWAIHPKARYFALHVVANCICAYASFPDFKRAFVTDPLNAFSGQSCSMVANSAASAIHLYHVLAFKLRADDIFHHVSFVIALCGLAIPYKQVGGVANNLGCFFLCGLPGALNYTFLVLYYHGLMSRKREKVWTARINVWLRGPAMSVYTFLGFQAWYRGIHEVPLVALILVVFLHFTNGQYYAAEAVASLTKHQLKDAGKLKDDDEPKATEGEAAKTAKPKKQQ